MTAEAHLVRELYSVAYGGGNEVVRQNAVDLLHKLASDGVPSARRALAKLARKASPTEPKGKTK